MSSHEQAALAALLASRYSCRAYLPDPLPRSTIEQILWLARRTASWCNSQPWRVHVLSGRATASVRDRLVEHARRHAPSPDLPFPSDYVGVYQQRRRECGLQLYGAVGVTRGDTDGAERQRLENFRFFGAPHVALVTSDRALGTYGAIDCGAFVNNFVLAARSLGVASIAQAALACHPEFWREDLALGEDRVVVCGISFGYEDSTYPANAFRTSRASPDEIATWVGWEESADPSP